jgi:tetratricopeptide (TPR) repeat protein
LTSRLYSSIYYGYYQPFVIQILQAIDEDMILPNDKYWLVIKKVYAGLKPVEPALVDVLSNPIGVIGGQIWVQAATRLLHYYLITGKPHDADRLLQKILRTSEVLSSSDMIHLYWQLGRTYWKTTKYNDALQNYNKALSFADDEYKRAQIKLDILEVLRFVKDFEDVEELSTELLNFWRRIGDRFHLAETYTALGDIYRFQGKWADAKVAYEETIYTLEGSIEKGAISDSESERGSNINLLGQAYGALSRYYIKTRELEYAEILLNKGMSLLARGGKSHFHYGWMKRFLGYIYFIRKDYVKAIEFYNDAYESAIKAGTNGTNMTEQKRFSANY